MDFSTLISNLGQWFVSNPLAIPVIAGLIFFLVAARVRAYPSYLFFAIVIVPTSISAAIVLFPDFQSLIMLGNGIIVTIAIVDLLLCPRAKAFSVERETLRVASLAKKHKATLLVNNRSLRSCRVSIKDDLPQEFHPDQDTFFSRIPGKSRIVIDYFFQPKLRGSFELESVHLKIHSPLGLWNKMIAIECANTIYVYPDMKQLGEYALLARKNRLNLMGVKRTRRIGQDNEFERLRDYTKDDNYRHIDWTSTARRNKLTVRDFQQNQSQRVIFMMDCGRMMTNVSDGLSMLDHSLNAILMLSYIALQRGDSVGLICFSDKVDRFVPAKPGMGQMNHLLHSVFDRQAQHVESRYDQAFLYLGTKCLQRSLVVMVTNVIDEVNSRQIEKYLSTLVGRHLPVGVLLRDHSIFNYVNTPPQSVKDVYQAAAASEVLSWRHQILTDLNHKGVLSLDVFPEDMTAPLINRYLDIKARHLL